MDSRFDDLLHTVITEKGQGIYGFFDVVFGFMYRRTDFFYEMAPGENMGFFPGQAEAIVYNYYRKYQNIHFKERVPKRDIDQKEIEEYINSQKQKKPEIKQIETKPERIEKPVEIKQAEVKPIEVKTEPKPVETKSVNPTFSSISTYNGDKCDIYNWSQGVMDVNIQVVLPEGTKKQEVLFFNLA
jgi:hypothetical protein